MGTFRKEGDISIRPGQVKSTYAGYEKTALHQKEAKTSI